MVSTRVAPGQPGRDHHGVDGERGVLLAAEIPVGVDPDGEEQDHEKQDEDPVPDGPGGKVSLHGAAAFCGSGVTFSGFTTCPSASEFTPAITTRSPRCSPSEIITPVLS